MIFKFSRDEALKLDLLICSCGHRPNNHFDFDKKSCAHCKCEKYEEQPRLGKIIKNKRKRKDYSWFGGEVGVKLAKAIVKLEKKQTKR
jgi:hypothetical protein